jgi:salicylate 5-hydroxylase small subunit
MEIEQRLAIQELYAEYAACLDGGRFEEWPEFFTEQCRYRLVPRENFDRNLPLSTLFFESKGMLKDRVYGVVNTLFHAPYYQRHLIGPVRYLGAQDGVIRTEANYLVIRTKQRERSEVYNAGRYLDSIVLEQGQYRFNEKICIFDSELIPNSIIYPI